MDPTTDPSLRSWIDVAPNSPFPIQNLPYGVFSPPGEERRIGVALGDSVIDLRALATCGLLGTAPGQTFSPGTLADFMAQGPEVWRATRTRISHLLRHDVSELRDQPRSRALCIHPRDKVAMHLPVQIGDYTDFYSSREHATNVGTMLRGPENALMPNWLHLPVAYHGRASSVVVSGTEIRRPQGQTKADEAARPTFGPSRAVDFELEVGFLVGPGNHLGQPIPIAQAREHIFGMVLVNDWSARDIQKWEYQPLGPFLSKNFATTISPWVVTLAALEPFRCVGPIQDPEPLPYLRVQGACTYDISLEAWLETAQSRTPFRMCATNFKHLYWSIDQQLAHHTCNGCHVRVGDLMASGTISGPQPDSYGSLIELSWKGTRPLELPHGERRVFLQDGDRVTLTGWCQGAGYRVGFGEATGQLKG